MTALLQRLTGRTTSAMWVGCLRNLHSLRVPPTLALMSGQFSPMGGDFDESPEAQAARAGRAAGFGFGAVRRRYTVGGCLGPRTVIGMLVLIGLMILFVSVTKGVPLLPPKKAPTVEASVRDFVGNGKVSITQGQISYAGASVLFLGTANNYQTATLLVDPTDTDQFLNGSFSQRGKVWCVAMKRAGAVVVTTNLGVQPKAVMCGALGAPVTAP